MKFSNAEADDRMFQGVRAHAPMNAITYDPLRRSIYYRVLANRSRCASTITYSWEHSIQIICCRDAVGRDIRPELCQSERQSTECSTSSGTTASRPATKDRQRVPDLLTVQIRGGACDDDANERHEGEAG